MMSVASSSVLPPNRLVKASGRSFVIAWIAGWIVLAAAAAAYARARHIPAAIALPVALAFLTEYPFYLLPGFRGLRESIGLRFTPSRLAAIIALSALLPYAVYSLAAASFHPGQAIALTAIMGAVAFWFLVPAGAAWIAAIRDLAFLALLAAVILSGVLRWIFPEPWSKLPLEVLGHITLIRAAIIAALLLRKAENTGFGFIPRRREIAIGAMWAVACVAVALPLAAQLGNLHAVARPPAVLPSLGVFLGILWVVALSEEFFFRALLQSWLIRWTGGAALGLIVTSLLFGACHLGFGGIFPNWRFAILAAVLGFFCGLAFLQGRGMRSSMITHALVASAFRLFVSWHAP